LGKSYHSCQQNRLSKERNDPRAAKVGEGYTRSQREKEFLVDITLVNEFLWIREANQEGGQQVAASWPKKKNSQHAGDDVGKKEISERRLQPSSSFYTKNCRKFLKVTRRISGSKKKNKKDEGRAMLSEWQGRELSSP